MHARLHDFSDALILAFVGLIGALIIALAAMSLTGTALDFDTLGAPDGTQANEWHGNIGTVGGGQDGTRSNANPNDDTNGIHNIAGIKGENRAGGEGNVPACTAHGGFNGVKKNCGG